LAVTLHQGAEAPEMICGEMGETLDRLGKRRDESPRE
jgi:hypothetical protein